MGEGGGGTSGGGAGTTAAAGSEEAGGGGGKGEGVGGDNVRALYAYAAQQDDELSFEEGHVIKLVMASQ